MFDGDLIVLDFETTGLSPDAGDRITEVAAMRIRKNRIVDEFESLVNCGVKLSPFIVSYTGITQQMVDGAPSQAKVMPELVRFLGSDSVIAHKASFDDGFFRNECRRLRLKTNVDPFICSIRIARRVYPHLGTYALSNIASSLGISYSGKAHRAAADARVTAEAVIKMAERIRANNRRARIDAALLRRFVEMPVAIALSSVS
jgi:DNA polymerase-3 subunit epsilon